MKATIGRLVRLRADPAKVRCSIRREGDQWRVWVRELGAKVVLTATGKDPTAAMLSALEKAKNIGMDGIDLDLMWAYDHPQGAVERKAPEGWWRP